LLSAEEDHKEFPFANGVDYPRFKVKDAIVSRKGDAAKETITENRSTEGSHSYQVTTTHDGEVRIIPRFSLDMDLPDIMRKDSSGLKDYDEEEVNFAPRQAVVASGKKAASRMTHAATGLTERTGLLYVVSPIRSGISSGMNQMRDMAQIREVAQLRENGGYELRRSPSTDSELTDLNSVPPGFDAIALTEIADMTSNPSSAGNGSLEEADSIDPALLWPEQNIDVEGPSTGKKLTDDLADIKDKMHEIFWHRFNDQTYAAPSPDAIYFGETKKSEKRRKGDVPRRLDKLLHVGQYSHSNPFVARVGLYVEPIIGSAYSFLCLFRAGHNIYTWRDPMLTFWLSLFSGILVIVLFVFPWRIFLFILGIMLVGPQNWVIRELRERGHLPPARIGAHKKEAGPVSHSEQPIFTAHQYHQGFSTPEAADIDSKEIQRVVVPYSPLMYQRFFDMPPEPQYAQVKRDTSIDEGRRKIQSSHNGRSAAKESTLLRRARFLRRVKSSDSLPPLPRKRTSTGDWQPRPSADKKDN